MSQDLCKSNGAKQNKTPKVVKYSSAASGGNRFIHAAGKADFVLGAISPYHGCYLHNCSSLRFDDSSDSIKTGSGHHGVNNWLKKSFFCMLEVLFQLSKIASFGKK